MRTKQAYENYLNTLECPEHELKSNGGLYPDNAEFGSWMRRSDPIRFSVGYNEWVRILDNS